LFAWDVAGIGSKKEALDEGGRGVNNLPGEEAATPPGRLAERDGERSEGDKLKTPWPEFGERGEGDDCLLFRPANTSFHVADGSQTDGTAMVPTVDIKELEIKLN